MCGIADRRQRIAQLVRERGEELVLAPVGVAQRFFGHPAIVDVRACADPLAHASIAAEYRRRAHGEVAIGAAGGVPQPAVRLVERLRIARLFPHAANRRPVVGVHRVDPSEVAQLIPCLAGIRPPRRLWRDEPPRRVGRPCDVGRDGHQRAEALLGLGDGGSRKHLRGNVPEIADHAVAAVGQRDAVDPPFVVLGPAAVDAMLDPLGRRVRVAGGERIAEEAHDLVRIRPGPQQVEHLVEVASDEIGNAAEHGACGRIDVANAKIGIDDIDAERRLVDERFILRRAVAQRFLGALALRDLGTQ